MLESEEDLSSVFSGFFADGDDTRSLPSIVKGEGERNNLVSSYRLLFAYFVNINSKINEYTNRQRI